MPDSRWPPYLPSLLAVLSWGAMFPIAAAATRHVDAVHLNAVRYIAALAIFLALLVVAEGRSAVAFDGRFARLFWLGALGFTGFNLLGYQGLRHTTPQHASLIVALMPVLTVLVRWAMNGVRPSRRLTAFVAMAFFGVALVVVGDDPGAALHGGTGDLLVLLGALCWVRYTLSAAAEFGDWSPLRFTTITAVGGVATTVGLAVLGDLTGVLSVPSQTEWGHVAWAMVYIVLFGAVVGVLGWNAGVKRLGPADAALFMNLVPVVTFAIEAVRGHTPGPIEIVGAVITLAALVGANTTQREPAPAPVRVAAGAPR